MSYSPSLRSFFYTHWEHRSLSLPFTTPHNWDVDVLNDGAVRVTFNGKKFVAPQEKITIKTGIFFSMVEVEDGDKNKYQLRGWNPIQIMKFQQKIRDDIFYSYDACPEKAFPGYESWRNSLAEEYREERSRGWVWIDHIRHYPVSIPGVFEESDWMPLVEKWFNKIHPKISYKFISDTKGYIDDINRKHIKRFIKEDSDFFDTVEKNPLTEEQRRAVACFAPRTLVVAAAGSGKSSVLAAKTAYAIKKKFFLPSEMLLLAFNNDAAAGLKNKVTSATGKDIEVCTFHKFCLQVIGDATKIKPSVARFISQGKEKEKMGEIFSDLLKNPSYKRKFDFYNLFFGAVNLLDNHENKENSYSEHRTNRGEFVKSKAEKIFADSLDKLGIRYEYEKAYPFFTADKKYSQYHPDFYLPQIDTWVEIWALADGEPEPEGFAGYQKGKIWKRKIHQEHQTKLKEFCARDIDWMQVGDEVWEWLFLISEQLNKQTIKPIEDKNLSGRLPFEEDAFVSLLRTFQVHAYNNDLSTSDLKKKISVQKIRTSKDSSRRLPKFGFRERLFLSLYEPAESKWREMLKQSGETDFEMMMRQAAEIIENGQWKNPYPLIMVDEFQDTSQLRARILKALLRTPKTRLFAVGDDWQSINRFAGSDLSIMRDFSDNFGESEKLYLNKTFRCSSGICEVSGRFISRNPDQISKSVEPAFSLPGCSVSLLLIGDKDDVITAVTSELERLNRLNSGSEKKKTVAVLGRFNNDLRGLKNNLTRTKLQSYPYLEVLFSTIHKSKGLEYDYVIVAKMEKGKYLGFPCQIEDNPLLDLVMPKKESYEFAEERRLLYVAVTRARSSVTIIANSESRSKFTEELINPKFGYSIKVEKLGVSKDKHAIPTRVEINKSDLFYSWFPEKRVADSKATSENGEQQDLFSFRAV